MPLAASSTSWQADGPLPWRTRTGLPPPPHPHPPEGSDMTDTTPFRIAGAPISWGVCEVPGWGYQLEPQQVLTEMREVGLTATELGPDGFLPADPAELAATLEEYGLAAVGGFTPVLVHEAGHDPVPDIAGLLDAYIAAKAEVMVLAAVTGVDGYDSRPELDDDGWKTPPPSAASARCCTRMWAP